MNRWLSKGENSRVEENLRPRPLPGPLSKSTQPIYSDSFRLFANPLLLLIRLQWRLGIDLNCYQPPPPVGGGLLCVPRPMRSPPFINVIGFKSLTLIFYLLQCRFLQSLRPLQTKFPGPSCMLSLLLKILLTFHAN